MHGYRRPPARKSQMGRWESGQHGRPNESIHGPPACLVRASNGGHRVEHKDRKSRGWAEAYKKNSKTAGLPGGVRPLKFGSAHACLLLRLRPCVTLCVCVSFFVFFPFPFIPTSGRAGQTNVNAEQRRESRRGWMWSSFFDFRWDPQSKALASFLLWVCAAAFPPSSFFVLGVSSSFLACDFRLSSLLLSVPLLVLLPPSLLPPPRSDCVASIFGGTSSRPPTHKTQSRAGRGILQPRQSEIEICKHAASFLCLPTHAPTSLNQSRYVCIKK